MEYIGRLLKYYPRFSRAEVWSEIPMDEGYAYIAIGESLDGWKQFNGLTISGKGYVAQEVDRLMAMVKK